MLSKATCTIVRPVICNFFSFLRSATTRRVKLPFILFPITFHASFFVFSDQSHRPAAEFPLRYNLFFPISFNVLLFYLYLCIKY